LTLDTWQTTETQGTTQELGQTRLIIDDDHYRSLVDIENRLRERNKREFSSKIHPSKLTLETPPECGSLTDLQLQVYLREEDDTGHFQLLGTRTRDGQAIATTPVMMRTVTL
jgi:hypothetical protein